MDIRFNASLLGRRLELPLILSIGLRALEHLIVGQSGRLHDLLDVSLAALAR